jgi:hypothetical protein
MRLDKRDIADIDPVQGRDRKPTSRDAVRTWRKLDERAGIVFWVMLFGTFVSLATAILASLVHIDPTQIEAGLVGAFLGASPVILMPVAAQVAFGSTSTFADRERLEFRGLTLFYGLLVVLSRLLHLWPAHTGHTSSVIAIGGLAAAILASWFLPHLPAGARTWARRQHPFQAR